jgi:hypothetical protein
MIRGSTTLQPDTNTNGAEIEFRIIMALTAHDKASATNNPSQTILHAARALYNVPL